jgi:hypothetical protein
MTSATTSVPSKPYGVDDLYLLRDDLARSYGPANAHERMLVTNVAESWLRLARGRDAERRFFEGRDLLAILDSDLAKYKIITKYVTDCERAWRASVRELERTQKRRFEAAGLGGRARRRATLPAYPADNWDVAPAPPLADTIAPPRRE